MTSLRATVARQLRRTGGRLTAGTAVIVVVLLAGGAAGAFGAVHRASLYTDAAGPLGRAAAAALTIHQSVADADAASLNAVLVGVDVDGAAGQRDANERGPAVVLMDTFRQDVTAASQALQAVSATSADPAAVAAISELTRALPYYAALVENGWSLTSRGFPLGTSYLTEASNLAKRLLASAETLRDQTFAALESALREANATPWLALATVALALVLLVWLQGRVTRTFRRKVNYGLAAATLLALGAGGWLVTATTLGASRGGDSLDVVEGQVRPVAAARVEARKADAFEARIVLYPTSDDFAQLRRSWDEADRLLGEARTDTGAARATVERWRDDPDNVLAPESRRDYRPAVHAITTLPATGPPYDALVEDGLRATADRLWRSAGTSTASARDAVSGVGYSVGVLLLLAAGAAVVGIRPRVGEYR
ncbi:hypothetical protein [Actinokineospora sp. NBRC 105648]|uniref:hypothetical protein n=1 Tax=Actinokineospora sp. NBRC 105648 TaxID=3032206 RepID=UPI00255431EA|nr:hypothetical protein [Actinokineospora sp. NBRC 105648]